MTTLATTAHAAATPFAPVPDELKPHLEVLRFSGLERIADRLESIWGSPTCERYLSELVLQDRTCRRGFEPQIFEAILHLSNAHVVVKGHGSEPFNDEAEFKFRPKDAPLNA